MKTLWHHVERARNQPHHVRRHLTFSIAFGASAIIGMGWFGYRIATDTFALSSTTFADAGRNTGVLSVSSREKQSGLLGAAGAAIGLTKDPARIEIVRTATSSTLSERKEREEQTIIPF